MTKTKQVSFKYKAISIGGETVYGNSIIVLKNRHYLKVNNTTLYLVKKESIEVLK